MRRTVIALSLLAGTAVALPAAETQAQARKPGATPTPSTRTAPRGGGFPLELALPLLGGGVAAAGGGALLLSRGRRRS